MLQNASLILTAVLAVFFYCGGPGKSYLDLTSEPELAWTEYLAQGDWAQQLEDLIGQPQEVWSGQERQMLMMDQTGQWYLVTFSRWWDGDYMQVGASRQDEVSLEGCTRIF